MHRKCLLRVRFVWFILATLLLYAGPFRVSTASTDDALQALKTGLVDAVLVDEAGATAARTAPTWRQEALGGFERAARDRMIVGLGSGVEGDRARYYVPRDAEQVWFSTTLDAVMVRERTHSLRVSPTIDDSMRPLSIVLKSDHHDEMRERLRALAVRYEASARHEPGLLESAIEEIEAMRPIDVMRRALRTTLDEVRNAAGPRAAIVNTILLSVRFVAMSDGLFEECDEELRAVLWGTFADGGSFACVPIQFSNGCGEVHENGRSMFDCYLFDAEGAHAGFGTITTYERIDTIDDLRREVARFEDLVHSPDDEDETDR